MPTMNIIDKIGELIDDRCGYCERPMPESSPSRDFCREACQVAWHAQRHFASPARAGSLADVFYDELAQVPGFAYNDDGQQIRAYQVAADDLVAQFAQFRQNRLASIRNV